MKSLTLMRQRGVTLIEMVIVIVVLAIAATALMDQFVNSAHSYQTNESVQTSAQLAQECAEHILATHRLQDYATAIASTCPALPAAQRAAVAQPVSLPTQRRPTLAAIPPNSHSVCPCSQTTPPGRTPCRCPSVAGGIRS